MLKKTRIIILFYFFLLISCSAHSHPISVRRITDRVAVISYLDVNVAVVKGNRGLVIIDTGRSPSMMSKVMVRIGREFPGEKVYRVINTHGDVDHTSGNQLFPDSIIIGQENCPEYMRQNYALSRIQKKPADHRKFILTPPALTFRDSFMVDAGGIALHLYYAGLAHTNNDIVIHIPAEKILLVGDLFYKNGWSFEVNRLNDISRVLAMLDRFCADRMKVEQVIPGHGEEFAFQDLAKIRNNFKEECERLRPEKSAALVLSGWLDENDAATALVKYEAFKRKKEPSHYLLKDEFELVGRHLLWRGELDKAIVAFQVAVRQYPESVIAFDDLAGAYLRRGDIDSAIANYKRSLEIYPGNRRTREILKRLR